MPLSKAQPQINRDWPDRRGGEVLPWFGARKKELANRPLLREQAFGEALDPDKRDDGRPFRLPDKRTECDRCAHSRRGDAGHSDVARCNRSLDDAPAQEALALQRPLLDDAPRIVELRQKSDGQPTKSNRRRQRCSYSRIL